MNVMEDKILLGLSLLLLLFFSGMETAWRYADKLRLELERKSAPRRYGMLHVLTRNPGWFNATLLTGYCLSLTATGLALTRWAFSNPSLQAFPPALLMAMTILLAVLLAFLFGELLPDMLFTRSPNQTLSFLAYPLSLFTLLLSPLAGSLHLLTRRGEPHLSQPGVESSLQRVFSKGDLDHFIGEEGLETHQMGEPMDQEVILFRNALDFSKVKLREIMVPRNEIAVLDINSDVETLRHKFVETGYSRILFYEGNKDNIVGYVHTSAIFQKAREIKPFLKSVLIVPETMAANRLLSRFIREHRSIALVVDEFGGTAGLVTSEDILEEIFGEIEDEHDTNDFTGRKINDRNYILPGRLEIDHLNEEYHLNIPESDQYETLAGFILFHHESIPRANTVVTIGSMNFKILKATLTRIEMVHLNLAEG